MKFVTIIVLVFLTSLGLAQSIDDLGGGNARPTTPQTRGPINWSAPFELALGENGWEMSGGPYSREVLFGLVAELVNQEWGGQVGSSTLELLNEASQRDALWNSEWVAESPRLQRRTLQPSEYALEIATGGSNGGGSRGTSLSLGGVTIALESGSAEAIIVVAVKDLVTGRRVKTLVGRAKYSSTNLEGLSVDRLFAGFRVGNQFRLDQWDNNPEFRRGMVATARAIDDLRKKMREFKSTSR